MNTFQEQLMAIKTEMNKENIDSNKIIETKVEVKDISIDKQIKQVKIEVNTNDKNVHSNINENVVVSKINYNKEEVKRAKRCEIWYVNLPQRKGSIQSGIRPFLVTSNPINNRFSTIVNGFPITSKVSSKPNIPVHIEIENFGLDEKSLVLTEQITTIDIRYDLMYYVGTVDEITMKRIDNARNVQLGDMIEKTQLDKLHYKLRNNIEEKLEAIQDIEKVIARTKSESLVNKLLSERGDLLYLLQIFCEDNNLNYRDFYVMYKKEKDVIAM